MPKKRQRRNPVPKAPAKRRFAGAPPVSPQQLQSSLARVRAMSGQLDERQRPFNPERAGSWRGSSRDLVVNGRMDEFTRGFLVTALWSSTDNADDSGGAPLDENYSIDDFDPASLAGLSEDCRRFQEENADDLATCYEAGIRGSDAGDEFSAGHDFWLTRCGHGAGFWDGDYPEPQATRLTEASKKFGNVDLYIGDDGVLYASGFETPLTPNGEQLSFRDFGQLDIPMPDFDWRQISGDMNPCAHGGIIARCDGGQIDLIEIQPVREYVGDDEAKEVGFPFWTKEASYDASDLSLSKKDVQQALQSVDLDPAEVAAEHRAEAIAEALMRYGVNVEEADGSGWGGNGFAADILKFPVKWWGNPHPMTFAEYCDDEDNEFRREVLGETNEYTYKMTYATWDEEALEAGETDDKGWLEEGSATYDSLEDVLNASEIKNKSWVEWSDSNPDGKRSWLISEDEEDNRTGARTQYNLWIERADGEPKSQEEIDVINEKLGISTFGRMRRNKRSR